MLYGKGMFIYQIERCEEGDARRIVERALAAGLRHVAIKIADGDRAYPFATAAERQTREAIGALKDAQDAGGYAKAQGEEFYRRQRA